MARHRGSSGADQCLPIDEDAGDLNLVPALVVDPDQGSPSSPGLLFWFMTNVNRFTVMASPVSSTPSPSSSRKSIRIRSVRSSVGAGGLRIEVEVLTCPDPDAGSADVDRRLSRRVIALIDEPAEQRVDRAAADVVDDQCQRIARGRGGREVAEFDVHEVVDRLHHRDVVEVVRLHRAVRVQRHGEDLLGRIQSVGASCRRGQRVGAEPEQEDVRAAGLQVLERRGAVLDGRPEECRRRCPTNTEVPG